MGDSKIDYQGMNTDSIEYIKFKDAIKDIKLCEKAYNKMINNNVRRDIILRPLYYLFVNKRLFLYELETRLNICGINDFIWKNNEKCNFKDMKKYLKERLEIDDHNYELPDNFIYLGYKDIEFWIKQNVAADIAWFYKGYSPYAYNRDDGMYHNIAYYLKENDF